MQTYSFSPIDPYRQFQRKQRKERETMWVAPEHARHASQMERAFPLDDNGHPMKELGKRLVLDPMPEIMRRKRNPIFLGLDA